MRVIAEFLYALFNNGEFPDKKEEEWFAWKIEEPFESDQDKLIEDDDVLINGEEEYGADCSAEFIAKFSSYLVWFKNV